MKTVSVFEFKKFTDYLTAIKQHYPGRKKPVTFLQWSRLLGYKSPRSLAMVANGTRLPSQELTLQLIRSLKMTAAEAKYFELLVLKAKHEKSGKDTLVIEKEIDESKPTSLVYEVINQYIFPSIANWYYLAIKQLAFTPSFNTSAAAISRRLRSKITPEEAKSALTALTKLKILVFDTTSRRLIPSNDSPLYTESDIPSQAVKEHHLQMMDRAKEALFEQPVQNREFATLTLRLNPKMLPAIKKTIREFVDQINSTYFDEKSDSVFQLNLQLFEHTE